ncbi:MAG TPA: polyprenyl synthetase family protein [Polyangium sp.]|nr:polyprenyl synthetase family protein [Polyangium sp.]
MSTILSAQPMGPSTNPGAHVKFPDQFRGIFARTKSQFAPMLGEARETLRALPVRTEVFPYYSYGVLEHQQPSFMLLPLMYLSLADHAGGIGIRHKRHLPWLMLAMEACAILDDTVDETPRRSGRPSYPGRFGAASAASFSAFLISTIVEQTATHEPMVLPLVLDMFKTLCALETWEFGSRYPTVDESTLAHWLDCRYSEVTPAVAYGLDSALLLCDLPPLPPRVSRLFAEIFQDVDDVVNSAEIREQSGENNDLKMGMVTHLLLASVRAEPSLAPAVDAFWQECQRAQSSQLSTLHSHIVFEAIANVGVPATVAKIISDADQCIELTPASLRPALEEMVLTFIDRLRRIDSLRNEVDRHSHR